MNNPQSSQTVPLPHLRAKPQHKVHHHRRQKRNRQNRGTKSIIETSLPSHPNRLCSPVECDERVEHGGDGDEGEHDGSDAAGAVTEVEEAHGEAAEDDGEV